MFFIMILTIRHALCNTFTCSYSNLVDCMYLSTMSCNVIRLFSFEVVIIYINVDSKPFCSLLPITHVYLHAVDELRKEVWRLRLNWLYTTLLCVLITTSLTSVTSSFHQFVINPRADSGSSNGTSNQVRNSLLEFYFISKLTYIMLASYLVNFWAHRVTSIIDLIEYNFYPCT